MPELTKAEKKAAVDAMITTAAAKIYLAMRYAELQFYWIRDMTDGVLKLRVNNAIRSIGPFTKLFEDNFSDSDQGEEYAGSDTEMISKIIDAFVQAEEKGIIFKFMNDFNRICTQNNLKV